MAKIVNVRANNDYTLCLELDNQSIIIYDMKPRLSAIRFCELSDLKKFQSVRIENGKTLSWGSLCQITIDEIVDLMQR